jgi:hypothetical protein
MLSADQQRMAILSPLPPPTRLQAVALLRFYTDVERELAALRDAENSLGVLDRKASINASIGALIASGTMSFDLAARYFGLIPTDPAEQLAWVANSIAYAHAAVRDALQHHYWVYHGASPEYLVAHDHVAVLDGFFDHYLGMGTA